MRELFSTFKNKTKQTHTHTHTNTHTKKNAQVGNELSNILPKSSHARNQPPPLLIHHMAHCTSSVTTAAPEPSRRILGGWPTPWSAEKMLDGRQRMDVPARVRTAHNDPSPSPPPPPCRKERKRISAESPQLPTIQLRLLLLYIQVDLACDCTLNEHLFCTHPLHPLCIAYQDTPFFSVLLSASLSLFLSRSRCRFVAHLLSRELCEHLLSACPSYGKVYYTDTPCLP